MRFPVNTRVLYTLLSAFVIILGSLVAIRYAQGYFRVDFVQGTGLLSANSFPSGAEVYVNGKLQAATDETLYLEPGKYTVEIRKDGYSPWVKDIQIERELVTQTNAQLFRLVPSLSPLTFTGVMNVNPSPDGQKLLFYTASASSTTKNGLYLLELSNSLLPTQREPNQIAEESSGFDLKTATFIWSPDNTQILMSSNGKDVLLDLNKKSELAALPDVSLRKKQLLREWEEEMYLRERQFLVRFPEEIISIATQSAANVYFSPDKKKLMYTATASATIPENITPALPASSTQPEERMIKPGSTYIYDREEDKNFRIDVATLASPSAQKIPLATDLFNRDPQRLNSSPSAFQRLQATSSAQIAGNFRSYYSSLYSTGVQWFPDSKHVFYSDGEKIYILGYDNTNRTSVYAGPFDKNFIYPWPDGSKILILTTFSTNTPPNLYGIELK